MSQRHPVSSGRTRSYHERRPCNPPTGSNPSPRQPHESTQSHGNHGDRGRLALDRPLITDRNSRVEVIISIPEATDLCQDFRQAWHEAMTGQTIPVAHLWDGIAG